MTAKSTRRGSPGRRPAVGSHNDSGIECRRRRRPARPPGGAVPRVAPQRREPAEDRVGLQRLEAEEQRHRPARAGCGRRRRSEIVRGVAVAGPGRRAGPGQPRQRRDRGDQRPGAEARSASRRRRRRSAPSARTPRSGRSRARSCRSPSCSPIRSGKCSLTSEGSSTFAIAMPASASIDSRQEQRLAVVQRPGPAARPPRASSASRVTRCGPIRRAAAGRERAEHRERRAPAARSAARPSAPLMCRPSRISSSTGPTLTAAGRRLNESSTIADQDQASRDARRCSLARCATRADGGRRQDVPCGT